MAFSTYLPLDAEWTGQGRLDVEHRADRATWKPVSRWATAPAAARTGCIGLTVAMNRYLAEGGKLDDDADGTLATGRREDSRRRGGRPRISAARRQPVDQLLRAAGHVGRNRQADRHHRPHPRVPDGGARRPGAARAVGHAGRGQPGRSFEKTAEVRPGVRRAVSRLPRAELYRTRMFGPHEIVAARTRRSKPPRPNRKRPRPARGRVAVAAERDLFASPIRPPLRRASGSLV